MPIIPRFLGLLSRAIRPRPSTDAAEDDALGDASVLARPDVAAVHGTQAERF